MARSQLCDALRLNSYKVLAILEQLDHALAFLLLALSLTVYAWDLSKLDALTVKGSLRPTVMERDKSDIATLGAARTVTFLVVVWIFAELPNRRNCAVTVTLPAWQA